MNLDEVKKLVGLPSQIQDPELRAAYNRFTGNILDVEASHHASMRRMGRVLTGWIIGIFLFATAATTLVLFVAMFDLVAVQDRYLDRLVWIFVVEMVGMVLLVLKSVLPK